MAQPKSLLRTVGSISSATALSRVLGLIRDQVQSFYFGAGAVTDAYVAAFRIPNLLRDLFAEGALSSAFVPTFIAVRERGGKAAAWQLGRRLLTILGLVLLIVTVLIMVGAPWILSIYAAGFAAEPGKMELAVAMTRILSPFLLCVALAAVAMGMLNASGRFFLPALSPAAFNVAAILGVVTLFPLLPRWGLAPGLALAMGAIVGGLLQFVVQWPGLRAEGFRFRPEWGGTDPDLRRIGGLMVPATIGLAATQINILVDTVLASGFGNGPITWLALAFRLIQLPIGLFGVAIATANLTRVSGNVARGDLPGLRKNLAGALRVAAMLALPATAGLIALREPIVRVIFEHGQFDAHATSRTAAAVLCYALGLFAYAVTKIQVPTFYALGEARTPVVSSVFAVTLKIAASFALITALPLAGVDPFLGLALSTSLAAWVNFVWLDRALRRRIGKMRGEGVLRTTLQMAGLSACLGGACHLVQSWLEHAMGGGGLPGDLARLALSIAVGGGVWLLGIWWLAPPELVQLLNRWRGVERTGESG